VVIVGACTGLDNPAAACLLWPPAMPSRERYGDVLQLRPDLWRVPLVMFLATLLFWEATAADALVKAERTDVEAAYRRAREAIGER
jgi:hypothetical protein